MPSYPSFVTQYNNLSSEQKNIFKKIPFLESIDGWLLLIEAVTLYDMASKIQSSNPVICEIGVWKGKSSYIFASVIKETGGTLYSIDPFNGDGDTQSIDTYQQEISKLGISLLDNFKKTMANYKLLEFIKIISKTSEKAFNEFLEQKIDLLFIDGNHDYESVKKDYDLWSPLVPNGGVIILHDVGANHVDGPKRVFNEQLLYNKHWKNVRVIGEMGVATKC
jgi:MMP 1-O-methyltransferase